MSRIFLLFGLLFVFSVPVLHARDLQQDFLIVAASLFTVSGTLDAREMRAENERFLRSLGSRRAAHRADPTLAIENKLPSPPSIGDLT